MNINLYTWFADRQLDFLPAHFVKCNATVNVESELWVLENLKGRFFIDNTNFLFTMDNDIYFEDPQEAVHYELTWS